MVFKWKRLLNTISKYNYFKCPYPYSYIYIYPVTWVVLRTFPLHGSLEANFKDVQLSHQRDCGTDESQLCYEKPFFFKERKYWKNFIIGCNYYNAYVFPFRFWNTGDVCRFKNYSFFSEDVAESNASQYIWKEEHVVIEKTAEGLYITSQKFGKICAARTRLTANSELHPMYRNTHWTKTLHYI